MLIYKIRTRNFESLVKHYEGKAALARALGCSASAISQCCGKEPKRTIGEKRARAIEKRLRLDDGWLDTKRA